MGFTLKVEMRKLPALIKRLDSLNGTEIDVGFFEDDKYGPENGNLHVAQVAAYNEFGTSLVPSRPFMSETFGDAMNQIHIGLGMKKVFESVLTNGRSTQRLLRQLGMDVGDMIQASIDDYPGRNSERWAAVKGFNDPLLYTGKMLNSVKFMIQ